MPKTTIKHRDTGAVLWESEQQDLRAALIEAVGKRARLTDADLTGADLRDAYLRGAKLTGAYLRGADLRGAKINGQSHALLSEILWRAAKGEPAREQLAAWIGRKAEWCWEHWSRLEHPHRGWAMAELAKWVKEGDGAPGLLRAERVRGGQQG
jgi:hypothetical protein